MGWGRFLGADWEGLSETRCQASRATCYLISDNAARPRQGRARPLVGAHGSRSKARSLSHYFGIFESELNGVSKRAPRPLPTYPRCHAEVVGGWSSRMPGWSRHVPCGMRACWRLIQHSHSSRSPSYLPKFRNQKPVNALRNFVCCRSPRLLVRMSATWSCVEMYFNSTSLALTFSLSQWYLTSKCLVRSARHGFVAILMQACESSCNGTVSVATTARTGGSQRKGKAKWPFWAPA